MQRTAAAADAADARNVVGGEGTKAENGRRVVAADHGGDLLDDDEKPWRQRLAGLEACKVQNEPHVVVCACAVPRRL